MPLAIAIALSVGGISLLTYFYREGLRQSFASHAYLIWQSFSLSKLLYTCILIGLVALFLTEIGRIWFERKTTIGGSVAKFQPMGVIARL
ncbi:hypothetical protein [Sedimentitalea sp.]|uniref:hypothetical protein n=1 Tax=Sedimentitalea sp. TaxID=2048915 RepID=UPI00329A7933